MIKYRLEVNGRPLFVLLDSSSPDKRSELKYSRNEGSFQEWLESSRGPFGHFIGKVTSPSDLHYVMGSPDALQFKPQIVQGAAIVSETYFVGDGDSVT